MATVKFPSEMAPATSIGGNDKLMISKEATGEAYQATFNQAKEYLNITGIELEPLVGGDTSGTALVVAPGPSGEQRTAEVASGKYYDFGSGAVLADADKRWKAYWSGSSWSLKDMGVLPQPDLTDVVKDEDLTVSSVRTNQQFNKLDYRANTLISGTTGLPVTGTGFETTQDIVIPSDEEYINWSGLSTSQHRITFYKEDNSMILQSLPSTQSGFIQKPALTHHVNFTYKHSNDNASVRDTFMLGFGQAILPYEPYYLESGITEIKSMNIASKYVVDVVPIEGSQPVSKTYFDEHRNDGAISTDKIAVVPTSKNLFNKDTANIYQGYIDTTNNYVFVPNPNYRTSDYIKVNELSQYFLSNLGNSHYVLGVEFSDENKVKIGGQNIGADATSGLISTIEDVRHIRYTWKTNKPGDNTVLENIQLEVGNQASAKVEYSEANLQIVDNNILQTPKTFGKVAILFGDSITETFNINGFLRNNWPSFAVRQLLWNYTNYAKSGAGFVHTESPDYPEQWLSVQIDHAQASGITPDIVLVSLGTNDLNDTLGSYDTAMAKTIANLDMTVTVEAARSNFHRLLTLYPNATFYYALPIERASMELSSMLPLINELRKMAQRYGFIVIEATYESGIVKDFEVNSGAGRYLSDGLHPNLKGQKKMSDCYVARILSTYNV